MFEQPTYVVLEIPSPVAEGIRAWRERFDPIVATFPVEITVIGSSGVGPLARDQDPAAVFATLDETDGAGELLASHEYADDGEYAVTVTITDDELDSVAATFMVSVANVTPVVDAGPDRTEQEGDVILLGTSFFDAGTHDTHTATIDWGDGTIEAGGVVEVPYGPFDGVLMTRDYTPLDPKAAERKYYAPGVGPVLVVGLAGSREELIRFESAG